MGRLYWVFDKRTKQVLGPYLVTRLKSLHYFGPDTKVAPEGSVKKSDWKKASEYPELADLFKQSTEGEDKEEKP